MNQALVQQLLDWLNNPAAIAGASALALAGVRSLIERLPWAHADSDLNALTLRVALYLINLALIVIVSGAAGTLSIHTGQDVALLLVAAGAQGILGHVGYAVVTTAKSASDATSGSADGAPPDGAATIFGSAQPINTAPPATVSTDLPATSNSAASVG